MHLSNTFKKTVCAVVSTALLSSSLLFSGCSTPKVAAVIDNQDYSTADYLAYLYNSYQQTFYYNNLYQYAQYKMDPWQQKLPYGEGDDAETLAVEDYIKRLAKDTMVRQKALQNKLDEYGIEYSESDVSEFEKNINSVSSDKLIALGFSKETYEKMYKAVSLNETTLFNNLYDNGGKRAMSDEDIRNYYDKNFLSYKIIEKSLVDDKGAELSSEKIDEAKTQLQKYFDMYKSNSDFDKVIEQYDADQKAEKQASESGSETSTTTTTTTATTTVTTSTTATDNDKNDDSSDKKEKDPNLKGIDANTYGDKDFTDAIKNVSVGEVKIIEYKRNGKTNTAALVLRLDPKTTEYNLENSRQRVIYGAKYKEFDAEIKDYMKTLSVKMNNGMVKKCSPKTMADEAAKLAK